jgi:hypothetical protein
MEKAAAVFGCDGRHATVSRRATACRFASNRIGIIRKLVFLKKKN